MELGWSVAVLECRLIQPDLLSRTVALAEDWHVGRAMVIDFVNSYSNFQLDTLVSSSVLRDKLRQLVDITDYHANLQRSTRQRLQVELPSAHEAAASTHRPPSAPSSADEEVLYTADSAAEPEAHEAIEEAPAAYEAEAYEEEAYQEEEAYEEAQDAYEADAYQEEAYQEEAYEEAHEAHVEQAIAGSQQPGLPSSIGAHGLPLPPPPPTGPDLTDEDMAICEARHLDRSAIASLERLARISADKKNAVLGKLMRKTDIRSPSQFVTVACKNAIEKAQAAASRG